MLLGVDFHCISVETTKYGKWIKTKFPLENCINRVKAISLIHLHDYSLS